MDDNKEIPFGRQSEAASALEKPHKNFVSLRNTKAIVNYAANLLSIKTKNSGDRGLCGIGYSLLKK